MRLDKFLKISRLIKRRSVAKKASEDDLVMVNEKIAKPSKEIAVGDLIKIRYAKTTIVLKVLSLNQSIKKEDASSMYEIIEKIDN
ncbi:MAG TPA: RNA-binding S4 domain-containing protein [Acholeplasma sp.]|nr:RNA-binding S4 domain-containing protein [Acholeplasma sp.]